MITTCLSNYYATESGDNKDFARVYTAGEWCGAIHPWSDVTNAGTANIGKKNEYQNFKIYTGTAWHFCLRLDHAKSSDIDQRFTDWEQIKIADVETDPALKTTYDDWRVFDERDLGNDIQSLIWHKETLAPPHSLWLPGAVTKQLIHQWMTAVFKVKNLQDADNPWVWLIADISREQAHTIAAVLLSETYSEKYRAHKSNIAVFLVTSDWYIRCLKTITGSGTDTVFEIDSQNSKNAATKRGADIYNVLRTHDSRLFWNDLPGGGASKIDTAFIPEKVIWSRNTDEKATVVLRGYLDLTHAFVDPKRFAVAKRALLRTWNLYAQNAECIAADSLLTNLLPREARLALKNPSNENSEARKELVEVGSVYVTGSTTEQAKIAGRSTIHLLRHTQFSQEDSVSSNPTATVASSRFALNWIDKEIEIIDPDANKLWYERIPGTPHISRGGSKAIPVYRFHPIGQDNIFFSKSIYGQSPRKTYKQFLQLGILKLGHWVYGGHHDLLTINLGLVVERESLVHGPMLTWLCKELCKVKQEGAMLVVYSSHSVTEKMVQAVKKIGSKDALPESFIPVNFLATIHAQTAIRIPSLTYDRICNFLTQSEHKHVVLLDDGALTGKVQRELEQLLYNAGAEKVINIGLVTRTGLPLYRQYLLNQHMKTHRYYWRWDVPPLGNARTCPLCRALEQARELERIMWNDEARLEINKWTDDWAACSVTSDWWKRGLQPIPLPDPRSITFGKEWHEDGREVNKYSLTHETTTGLTSTVIELIRTTSYKEVGLKLARQPWGDSYDGDKAKWRDTQLEILICQLLLFFDDFSMKEIDCRFEMLFDLLLEPLITETYALEYQLLMAIKRSECLERLTCLTLLLTTDRQANIIIKELGKRLAKVQALTTHILIIIGILIRRANYTYDELIDSIPDMDAIQNEKIKSLIATAYSFGLGEDVRCTRTALRSLILLLGENETSSHTGFLRRKTSGEMSADRSDIARDLTIAAQALRDIDTVVLTNSRSNSFDPQACGKTIFDLIELLMDKEKGDKAVFNQVHAKLFGNTSSLAPSFQSVFFMTIKKLADFLGTQITGDKWTAKVEGNQYKNSKYWMNGKSVIRPTIDVSMLNISKPDDIVVIFPPIAQKMVRDYLYNVIHSSKKYIKDKKQYDMSCNLTISDDILFIVMKNYTKHAGPPQKKLAESIVSQHLLKKPVIYKYSNEEMIVTIQLPLIKHLGRSEK